MTPAEALDKAQSGFGSNFIADQDPEELVKILDESMVFYSENAVITDSVEKLFEEDETTPAKEGVFTFTLPDTFRYLIGLSDDEGIEQLYRIAGNRIVVKKCENAVFPLLLEYAIDLTDWGLDNTLPNTMMKNPLINLIKAKVGVFNNQCLKDIGKFTQAAEESGTDWDSKVTAAEDKINNMVYIPTPKGF